MRYHHILSVVSYIYSERAVLCFFATVESMMFANDWAHGDHIYCLHISLCRHHFMKFSGGSKHTKCLSVTFCRVGV